MRLLKHRILRTRGPPIYLEICEAIVVDVGDGKDAANVGRKMRKARNHL